MVFIVDLISAMKSLYQMQGTIRFCHPVVASNFLWQVK